MTVRQVVDGLDKEIQQHQTAIKRIGKLKNRILEAARLEGDDGPSGPAVAGRIGCPTSASETRMAA